MYDLAVLELSLEIRRFDVGVGDTSTLPTSVRTLGLICRRAHGRHEREDFFAGCNSATFFIGAINHTTAFVRSIALEKVSVAISLPDQDS